VSGYPAALRSGDYLDRLGRFVVSTPVEDIPSEVLDRTRAILLDTFPVIAAGMRTPELVSLSKRQMASGSPGRSWVIGSGQASNRFDAALLNGIAGAWLDFDEGNFLANGHPGIQVIPAALALAQERGLHGRELLTTIALAYEVVSRIGMATKAKLIINPHGTFGVVGAALASARLSGFDADGVRNLASLAASACMATNRHTMLDGATIRNWYAGHSGFMGQMAVRLAESGFSGPSDGVNTTFSLVLGDGFSPDVAVAELGERWLLTEGYLKLYPTARYVHSCIDAYFDAVRVLGRVPEPEEVMRIDVRAYRLAAFLANQHPKGWFGTRFSLPFAVATLLVGGRSGLDAFSDEAVADPRIRQLSGKVHVVEDEAYTAQYPAKQRVTLTMRLAGGQVVVGECEITSGEPSRPHDSADLERKFHEIAEPIWGAQRASQIQEAILSIDRCTDVSKLLDFNP
jgi:2-methylcitrate dehydratase PrpD